MIASHEVVKMVTHHRLCGQRVLDGCAIIIDPNLFRRFAFLEEQDIGLYALGIEDARRKTEDGVQVVVLQQLLADGLACTSFKQHIVGQYDGSTPRTLQHHHDML